MSGKKVLELDGVVVASGGRSLSLELFEGDAYAVMGPSGSCKSDLVHLLQSGLKPQEGAVARSSPPAVPRAQDYGRRHTPQGLAKRLGQGVSFTRLTQVLSGLGLWEHRQLPVTQLDMGLQAACDLLPVFLQPRSWAVVDGQLDALDPWSRESALDLVDDLRRDGCAVLVETNLTTVAARLGNVVVFRGPSPVFAGSVQNLIKSVAPAELFVETDDPGTVKTMVEPLTLSVRSTDGGLVIEAEKGQEVAARLIVEGYGRVKAVVLREASLSEALKKLF